MPFEYAFFQNALAVSVFIAILSPCVGLFLVLRRYSMIGDTLAHASLAGITASLLLGGSPIVGAFVFTSFCGLLIEYLRSFFRKFEDLVLTVILSLSVGTAITIISSGRLRSNANAFMFGSVLTVSRTDVYTTIALSVFAVLALVVLYDRLVYIAFDEDAARILGVGVKTINYVFSLVVAATIAISIRIVGVLVLGSLIAIPVATALQFGRSFRATLLLSILFSLVDILGGLLFSYYFNVAPGGFTALLSSLILLGVILAKGLGRRILTLRASRPS